MTRGTRSTPSPDRHADSARGSGPVSITTAVPSLTRTTVASPWPTSQKVTSQSAGGQPGWIGGRTSATTRPSARPITAQRRRHSTGSRTGAVRQAAPKSAIASGWTGQATAAPGSTAANEDSQHRPCAHAPASHPSTVAAQGANGAQAAAANPKTVAGPTSGPATRLARIPTTLI